MLTLGFISWGSVLQWFVEGTLALQIFRIIAVAGFLVAILLVILNLFGGDHEIAEGDGSHIFSFPAIAGFMLGFGGIGAIMIEHSFSPIVAALGGSLTGFVIGGSFFLIMRFFGTLKEDNTFKIESCLGLVGTVYARIPAGASGGQIQVVAQSRMVTLPALSQEELSSGAKVRIVEIVGHDTVKVERVG